MASFKEIRTLPVESFLVDGDNVVIRWVFGFVRADGKVLRMDEVAEERFYYRPGQMRG